MVKPGAEGYTGPTKVAYWVGFGFMVAGKQRQLPNLEINHTSTIAPPVSTGALYVLKSSFHGRHKESRIFHYITALVRHLSSIVRSSNLCETKRGCLQIMIIASLAYFTMAIGSLDSNPFEMDDVNIVQF